MLIRTVSSCFLNISRNEEFTDFLDNLTTPTLSVFLVFKLHLLSLILCPLPLLFSLATTEKTLAHIYTIQTDIRSH